MSPVTRTSPEGLPIFYLRTFAGHLRRAAGREPRIYFVRAMHLM